jgi:hypothetical protein
MAGVRVWEGEVIDTRRAVLRLTSAGFDRRQAVALAEVLRDAFGDAHATRSDHGLTASEMTSVLQRAKWHLVASQIIVSGALFVALKFIL